MQRIGRNTIKTGETKKRVMGDAIYITCVEFVFGLVLMCLIEIFVICVQGL